MNAFELNESTGRYRVRGSVTPKAILDQAAETLVKRLRRSEVRPFTSPNAVRQYITLQLPDRERETFACLFLDNRHRLIAYEELFQGTIDGATVHPREVVKSTLRYKTAALILAHNHPGGVAEPSQADMRITQRLVEALCLVDVRVLDHFVVGDGEPVSMAERGLL